VANLSKTVHINFYQNRSTFAEVMHKSILVFFKPHNVPTRKMSQDENYDISEMHEYFCTKFCSFVYKTTAQKCAGLCCI